MHIRAAVGVVALGLTTMGMVASAPPAVAATIAVTTDADELNNDGDCSLREAVEAANTDAVVDDCSAGSGADVINLPPASFAPAATLVLTDPDGLTLAGATAGATSITGSDDHRIIDVSDGALVVSALTLTHGDSGLDQTTGKGGAIRSTDDAVEVRSAAVTNNHGAHGGAIETSSGDVTIIDSMVSDNLARWNDLNGNGGAIDSGDGEVVVTNSTFARNTAVNAGGGILTGGTIEVSGSTFVSHSATFGSGLYAGSDPATITNSTFDANTIEGDEGGVGYGSAIQSTTFPNTINLVHVTVTGTIGGSGVSGASTIALANSVLADNAEGNCFNFGSGGTSNGGNLDDDDSCSLDDPTDLTGDPELAALGANGGPTQTRLPLAESPLIDSAVASECEPSDQRGVDRPQDGDDDGDAACDRGAVEVQSTDPTDPTEPPAAQPADANPSFTG